MPPGSAKQSVYIADTFNDRVLALDSDGGRQRADVPRPARTTPAKATPNDRIHRPGRADGRGTGVLAMAAYLFIRMLYLTGLPGKTSCRSVIFAVGALRETETAHVRPTAVRSTRLGATVP
ncbi:hypothetical protein [Streptomyces sp. NBC_01264]|uniref:hypothetical protein n=1 Tax=Streptomyces sp. NBC_01264 TaxID=2903804 RepID=UPI0022508969|nr:hypothetical protein [Streptomyces sp. NBC_01264]MCX4783611.1 hypothetical protein [Streptomyces sp. NBC_01264]